MLGSGSASGRGGTPAFPGLARADDERNNTGGLRGQPGAEEARVELLTILKGKEGKREKERKEGRKRKKGEKEKKTRQRHKSLRTLLPAANTKRTQHNLLTGTKKGRERGREGKKRKEKGKKEGE